MKDIKISFIGAGGSFTIGMIHDICLTPNLHNCTLSFMDVNEERLDNQIEICSRYAKKEMGIDLVIEKTMDRRESLKGADFVITTALVDGSRRLREGWEIAGKHGIKWPGSYHIKYDEPFWLNYYQMKMFEGITEDMLEICPDAWHLMVSNPVLMGTTHLLRKYPKAKMVGLCHGFSGVYQIADILGLDRDQMNFEIPGVNHFVWLTSLYHKGQDMFPVIDKWIEQESQKYWADKDHSGGPLGLKGIDLYKKLGAFPIGDTANWTGASWPWWYHSDREVEAGWKAPSEKPWLDYVNWLSSTAETMKNRANDKSISIQCAYRLDPEKKTGETMMDIVESISFDIPRAIIVNIQNYNEYVPGIPRDFEVEIAAMVSARGIQGIKTNGLPQPILAHIYRDRIAPVEMELAAYNTGSRDLLVQLILMDKWATSEKAAYDFLDEIFALPYHEELRKHYK